MDSNLGNKLSSKTMILPKYKKLIIGLGLSCNICHGIPWYVSPTSPSFRWPPEQNSIASMPWQISYEWDGTQLRIGTLIIEPTSKLWDLATKIDDCVQLRSTTLFDPTLINKCPLSKKTSNTSNTEIPFALINNSPLKKGTGTLVLASNNTYTVKVVYPQQNTLISVLLSPPRLKLEDMALEQNQWTLRFQAGFKPPQDKWSGHYPYEEELLNLKVSTETLTASVNSDLGIKYDFFFQPPSNNSSVFEIRPRGLDRYPLVSYAENLTTDFLDDEKLNRIQIKQNEIGKWTSVIFPYRGSMMKLYTLRMPFSELSLRISYASSFDLKQAIPVFEGALLRNIPNLISQEQSHVLTNRLSSRLRYLEMRGDNLDYQMTFQQLELRANILPAIWNWDEAFGPLITYLNANLGPYPARSLGYGLFWGKPLPVIFDRLLSWIPGFHFPKYTDLDFSYFHDTTGLGNSSWISNFHGKMILPDFWFVEGGISVFQVSAYSP